MTRKYEIVRLEKMVNDEVIVELKELSDAKEHIVDKGTVQPLRVDGTTDGIETEPTYNQQMNMLKMLPKTESIPVPENEEEEIIAKQVSAMRKFLPELFPKPYDSISLPTSLPTMCYPVKENTILYLKYEQVKELNITIGSIVYLAISLFKGD